MRIADSTSVRIVPSATVEPMSLRIGTAENESSPKPNTVERFANMSETSVPAILDGLSLALEEERIVRTDRDDEQQTDGWKIDNWVPRSTMSAVTAMTCRGEQQHP